MILKAKIRNPDPLFPRKAIQPLSLRAISIFTAIRTKCFLWHAFPFIQHILECGERKRKKETFRG